MNSGRSASQDDMSRTTPFLQYSQSMKVAAVRMHLKLIKKMNKSTVRNGKNDRWKLQATDVDLNQKIVS